HRRRRLPLAAPALREKAMRSFSFIDLVSLVAALRWTVALVVLALAFGAPLALGLAMGRISRCAGLRWAVAASIQVVQSVPPRGAGGCRRRRRSDAWGSASRAPRSPRSSAPSSLPAQARW